MKTNSPEERHPIAMTVDLEFWWCSEFLKGIDCEPLGDIIEPACHMVLDSLEESNVRATFFILGEVAERYPAVIEAIRDKGHEIANHGFRHTNVFDMTPEEFERDLKKSTALLQSIAGVNPVGYRAPNFSFSPETVWPYTILEDNGYLYSSSVFPLKTRLYGIPQVPLAPYSPSQVDITVPGSPERIREFPATVVRLLGKRLPVSGGFYFRVLPVSLIRRSLECVLKSRPASFYIHLRDLYPSVPRLKGLPPLARFFHYYGIDSSMKKFERLMARFNFQTMKSVILAD